MDNTQKTQRGYKPNYQQMIEQATTEEERAFIEQLEKRNMHFSFNMVYVIKLECGHYTIHQTPQNEEYYPLKKVLEHAKTYTKSKCSKCNNHY